jgi:hypothetical protein
MEKMIDNLYQMILEQRADWVTIQTLIVAEHLLVPIADRAELSKQIRLIIT